MGGEVGPPFPPSQERLGWALSSAQKDGIQTGLSPRDLEPADEGLERSWSVLSTPQCLCSTFGKCKIKSFWWVSLHVLTSLRVLGSDPLTLISSSSFIGVSKSEEQECSFFWNTVLGGGITQKPWNRCHGKGGIQTYGILNSFVFPAEMLLASFRSSHLSNLIFLNLK